MRVVGGEWKGRPLVAPAGRATRPTSDKVREAVFGMLAALPAGLAAGLPEAPPAGHAALDLFAGSGAMGIEALSRGARTCTFVDHDRAALDAVRRNLERVGAGAGETPRARLVGADVRRALQADARRGERYTLVFVDPPYARYDEVRPALLRLLPPVLAVGAVLVVETAAGTAAALPWALVRERRYGDTRVSVLVAGGETDDGGVAPDHEATSA